MDIGETLRKLRLDSKLTLANVEDATGVSKANQSKIELGDNLQPGFSVIGALARLHGISMDALYSQTQGEAPRQLKLAQSVPILDWEDLNHLESINRADKPSIQVPRAVSSDSFAIKVVGDSMVSNNNYGPSFNENAILIVDRSTEAKNKSFVIARLKDSNDITFKQLIYDAAKGFLKPLNTMYPMTELTENVELIGVIDCKIEEF